MKEKGDTAVVKQLATALSVSESLANLMVQRNITSPGEADAFFNPSLDYLHDPFLMKDMSDQFLPRSTLSLDQHGR